MNEITRYGLVVEGPYDQPFYEALVRRICDTDLRIETRVCDGVTNLMKLFPAFLAEFEHLRQGQPVHKALVIRDSKGADTTTPRLRMEAKIAGRGFAFPRGLQLCVVRREMETWLLADHRAINAVAGARGGRQVSEVTGSLEGIEDPKARLRYVLSEARIEYTEPVCAEIVSRARLDTLEYRCPSFRTFKQQVLDC